MSMYEGGGLYFARLMWALNEDEYVIRDFAGFSLISWGRHLYDRSIAKEPSCGGALLRSENLEDGMGNCSLTRKNFFPFCAANCILQVDLA